MNRIGRTVLILAATLAAMWLAGGWAVAAWAAGENPEKAAREAAASPAGTDAQGVPVRYDARVPGMLKVLEIVPEGTEVKPGDVLARLDASPLEEQIARQRATDATNEMTVIEARGAVEMALVAKKAYLEAEYVLKKMQAELAVFVAHENLREIQCDLEAKKAMFEIKKEISSEEVNRAVFAVDKAKIEVNIAEARLRLLNDYEKVMAIKRLDTAVKLAETRLKTAEHAYQLELERLTQIEQAIARCTIKAPVAGKVVYEGQAGRGGTITAVVPGRVILRIVKSE